MSKCDNCGRDDGHWIGCAGAPALASLTAGPPLVPTVDPTDRERTRESECIVDNCSEPRRSADKRVKFCETHSDPKNRK